MKINLEKKILINVSVFALTAMIIAGGIIWPTVNFINKINRETYNLRLDIEKKYENAHRMHAVLKQINQIKPEAEKFKQYLFKSGDELKLITMLENIATQNKINQKIESSDLDKKIGQQIHLVIAINGNYQNTLHYLSDLNQLPYFLNVEKLEFSPENVYGKATGNVNLRLNLSLYVNAP